MISAFQQPVYYIILFSVCQVLFSNSFQTFFRAPISEPFGPFLRQLVYYTIFRVKCQYQIRQNSTQYLFPVFQLFIPCTHIVHLIKQKAPLQSGAFIILYRYYCVFFASSASSEIILIKLSISVNSLYTDAKRIYAT